MKTFWRNFLNKPGWFMGTIISLITFIVYVWHMIDHNLYLYTVPHFPNIAVSVFLWTISILLGGFMGLSFGNLLWKTWRKILYLRKLKNIEKTKEMEKGEP